MKSRIFSICMAAVALLYCSAIAYPVLTYDTPEEVEYPDTFGPENVEDLKAEFNATKKAVVLTFTTPTEGWSAATDYLELPYIDKIEVYRNGKNAAGEYKNGELIYTFGLSAPGKKYEYVDKDIKLGEKYDYYVYCWFNNQHGYSNWEMGIQTFKGSKPAAVAAADFTVATADEKGNVPVVLTAVAPSKDVKGNALESLKALVFVRGEGADASNLQEVGREENPEPGAKVTFNDETAELNKTYTYGVYASTDDDDSDIVKKSVKTGQDIPAEPTNLDLKNNKTSVVLTWDAVTTGATGGYFNPDDVTYTICEYDFDDYESFDPVKEIKSGLKETTATLDFSDLIGQEEHEFMVKAVAPGGESELVSWPAVVVGNPSVLPYVENFNKAKDNWGGIKNENYWKAEAFGGIGFPMIYCTTYGFYYDDPYNYMGENEFTGIDGSLDGEEEVREGMIGSFFSMPEVNTLTSGEIALGNAKCPVVTFHVFQVPSATACDALVRLETAADGGEFETVAEVSCLGDEPQSGWHMFYAPLDAFTASDFVNLRFNFVAGETPAPVFVDAVEIDDYPYAELQAAPEVQSISLTWMAPAAGNHKVAGYNLYADGEKVNDELLTATAYEYARNAEEVSVKFELETVYDNGVALSAPEMEVAFKTSGIATAADDMLGITLEPGRVLVSNPDGVEVRVVDLSGRALHVSSAHEMCIDLAAGIYLVNGRKVLVKD